MTKLKAFSPRPSLMAGVKTARDPCCHPPAVPQSPAPSQHSAVQHLPWAKRAWSPDLCPHHSFPTGGGRTLLVGCSPTFPARPGRPGRRECSSAALEDSALGSQAAGPQVRSELDNHLSWASSTRLKATAEPWRKCSKSKQETWKQPECPSTDRWIKKIWYVCVCIYIYIYIYNGILLSHKKE